MVREICYATAYLGLTSLAALAVQFSDRPGSATVRDCLGQWRYAYDDVQAILQMADAVSNGHVAARFLNIWRKRLRNKLKMIKMARAASKYFLNKQVYLKWREKAAEKHRERLLASHTTHVQMKKFQGESHLALFSSTADFCTVWLQKTRVNRSRAAALKSALTLSDHRAMHSALSRWVQRTVEIKEREFQITQQIKMVLVM
jgi:protein SFI1